jgi:hypothetical protein
MSLAAQFAYVQPRLQARYGQLPDATDWRRLEAITALSHLLQTARTTGLRPWLFNIAAQGDSHMMEKSLRVQLRHHIDEVARWLPPPWRPALAWCAVLPDLPALQHLLDGAATPGWLLDDERLKPYGNDLQALRLQALRDSPYAPLLDGAPGETHLAAAWAAHWRSLWPLQVSAAERAALEQLAGLLEAYYAALGADASSDSTPARAWLERRLRAGFRHYPRQGATAYYYLALVGLSLERLRGLLARLILFPRERAS